MRLAIPAIAPYCEGGPAFHMSNTPATPSPEAGAAAAAPKKGSSKSKLFITIGAVVVVLGGGGAAFWMMRTPAEAKEAAAPKEQTHAGTGVLGFEPFVVNLADAGGQRFLRVNIRLVVKDEEEVKRITHSEAMVMRLRADILDLLMTQTSEKVVTPEGKAALKKEIGVRTRHIIEPFEVEDVLFSDFVVQY